jgi:uncharacterized membrane protein YbhN (UPF0104 family)
MKKKILLVIRYVFFLGLGILLAWIPLHSITPAKWTEIKTALAQARYFLLIPIIILYLLSHWSRAIRWKIMIGPLGYRPQTLNVFFAVMIGYLVNLALPRLGEVVKCSILGRHEKIPIDQLLGTIIVERVFDLLCLAGVFALAFSLQAKDISDYAFAQTQARTHGLSGRLLSIFLIGLAVTIAVLFAVYRKFKTHRLVQWLEGLLLGMWGGIIKVRHMQKKGWFLFHTVFIWSLYFICTRLGLYALKDLDNLGIKETLSVLGVGSIGMIVTQGGLGAYPLLVQHTLMFYHIPDVIALAAGNLLWALPTLLIILGGLLSFFILTLTGRSPAATGHSPAVVKNGEPPHA